MNVSVHALSFTVSRRELLESSDGVLNQVESLRLAQARVCPEEVALAVTSLYRSAGKPVPRTPSSLRAASDLIFSLQQRLMASNPRNDSATRTHVGCAAGQPRRQRLPNNLLWKELTLPGLPQDGSKDQWLELARLTVARAEDRWLWAIHHAARASRCRAGDAVSKATLAKAAWENYFDLCGELERLSNPRGLSLVAPDPCIGDRG